MPHHGMTPHISGSSLSAQTRYAAGTREILECWFGGKPIRDEYLIVDGGKLAGTGAHSYSDGNATKGSDEAAELFIRAVAPEAALGKRRTAEQVVVTALSGLDRKRSLVVDGLMISLLSHGPRLNPRLFAARCAGQAVRP